MRYDTIKNAKGKQKYFYGFGVWKTGIEWARAMGLPSTSVYQYLYQGMTPEEIAELRGVLDIKLEKADRKAREGHRQLETKERVMDLLDFSDYDPDGVTVSIISGAFRHQVVWNDMIVGAYDPDRDILQLSGGDRIGLRRPAMPEMQIHHKGGFWYLTPETKEALVKKMAEDREWGWKP